MNRRQFVARASAIAAAGALGSQDAVAAPQIKKLGIQLFSVPKLLEMDFDGTLQLLASMGYSELEFYGPYPFSDSQEISQWLALKPTLGFSGSGFFGKSSADVSALLKRYRLTAPSMHTDLATLQQKMPELAAAAHAIGATYVVLPAIPADKRQTLDDYRKMADVFNSIGAQAKREGVRFGYHNHGYGWHEMSGQVPLPMLLAQTDPKLVFLEMDIYWTTAGGAAPVELLKTYPKRYRMMHLKDMKQLKRFSGDGGDPSQWIELFPYMTTVGDGVLDIKAIVAQARMAGVEHFFVEQDVVANPEVALRRSADYLRAL